MASAFRGCVAVVHGGARNTLHTSAEVDAVVVAAEQLAAVHYKHFDSPWDVPKLICAVLRAQLNARMTAAERGAESTLVSLLHLLVLGWRLCPLLSLPLPSSSAGPIECIFSFTERDLDRVADELEALQDVRLLNVSSQGSASQAAAVESARCALSILMSLLAYWHVLAAETSASSSSSGFYRVSEVVWRCVQRWANSQLGDGARAVAVTTWMRTVLRRALAASTTTDSAALLDTVCWLSEMFSSSTSSSSSSPALSRAPVCVPSNDALTVCWTQLHVRVAQHVAAQLHGIQAQLKVRWSEKVVPVLTRAVAREPPLLSGCALQPFDFGDSLPLSLEALQVEACYISAASGAQTGNHPEEPSPLDAVKRAVDTLLQLTHLQQNVEAAGLRMAPFVTPHSYTTFVRPVVAVCLRWGLVSAAAALLDAAGEGLDAHGKAWQARLRRVMERDVSAVKAGDAAMESPLISSEEHDEGTATKVEWPGGPYAEYLRHPDFSTRLPSVSQALSAMTHGADVAALRVVCDALLRCPSSWSAAVFADPFVAFFVLHGLSTLCTALMDAGDVPLARFYVALLAQLLTRSLCPTMLHVWLVQLQRLAQIMSAHDLSDLDYSVPSSSHGKAVLAWREVAQCLEMPAAHTTPYVVGQAMELRQKYHHQLRAASVKELPSPLCPTAAAPSGAKVCCDAVEVFYTPDHGGTLRVSVSRLYRGNKSVSAASSFTARCRFKGEMLRGCAADMTEIIDRNRTQLLHGSGGGGCGGGEGEGETAAVEKAMCADSQGVPACTPTSAPTLYASSPPPQARTSCSGVSGAVKSTCEGSTSAEERHRRKEAWWQARFDLDHRISSVVDALQETLGAVRVLFAGQLSDDLTSRLAAVAADFASACVRLRQGQPCPPFRALQRAALLVLVGGPYLWSIADEGRSAQPTCLYGPTCSEKCLACTATLQRARRTLLSALVEVGQSGTCGGDDTFHDRGTSASRTSSELERSHHDEAWVELLMDPSLTAAVEQATTAALAAFFEAPRGSEDDNEKNNEHQHRDLLLLPRTHTYIILGSELHTLPWEGIDVCQGRSTSRVPSLAFLQRALSTLTLQTRAVSVQRTFVYRDCDGQHNPSALTQLLAQHPTWEVEYGDTLCAAAATMRAGGSQTSELLVRLTRPPSSPARIDTYVYSGHKGGEQLISRSTLYEWVPRTSSAAASLVLLMGCSSARMHGSSLYESFGLPFAYLSAGLTCVVGCLWDVTDGDIDRVTSRLIAAAAAAAAPALAEPMTVGECVAVARRACRLRCLTGLSTVLYGLNLPIRKCDGGR